MAGGFKKFTRDVSYATPDIFVSEGLTPDRHVVASYLPLLRYDKREEDYKVICLGKPVAVDTAGYIVPAGLGVQLQWAIDAAGANLEFGTSQTAYLTRYNATDVAEGVKNSLGILCIVGEPVIWSMLTTAVYTHQASGAASQLDTTASTLFSRMISGPVGLIQYDAWRQNGAGFTNNPTNYTNTNYNMQQSVGIITESYIEVPMITGSTVLAAQATADAMPQVGNCVFVAPTTLLATSDAQSACPTPTGLQAVKVAADSNFQPWIKGTDNAVDAIGKILRYFAPADFPRNALDKVKSWPGSSQASFGVLDTPASYQTGGLPEKATYAGLNTTTVKLVRINVDFV